jgi:DNA adenine methylase
MSEKKTTLSKISSKDIENFNDTLSDDGICDIKEYKEHFLKYFDKHFKEYYEDFENYFSDSESSSSSDKESDSDLNIKSDSDLEKKNIYPIYPIVDISTKINNKSPLRYPGGKTRACEKLDEIISNIFNMKQYNVIISPFFGGGSFEFFLQNKYNKYLIVNDKFKPLFSFWKTCKYNNNKLIIELNSRINTDKKDFKKYRDTIMEEKDTFLQSVYYFIINRCSFSGSTLSGGFSDESSKKRFTPSSIDRVNKLDLRFFDIYNYDFKKFINEIFMYDNIKPLMFLDPPYYLGKKSKLYGKNGDMHEQFDHEGLSNVLNNKKGWIMTYNNCEYIRELYKNFTIIETNWSYGMNKSKKSSEIIIFNQ